MRRILLALLIFCAYQASGQRLENIRAEAIAGGDRVAITFDITGGQEGQKFRVSIYGSHNNFSAPLQLVSGDVGEITPGKNKRVEWNAKNELVEFNGNVTFEVRADGIAPVSTPLTNNDPPLTPEKSKKKSKAAFIIIPAVVVVGVVAVLLLKKDKGSKELPGPPDPEE